MGLKGTRYFHSFSRKAYNHRVQIRLKVKAEGTDNHRTGTLSTENTRVVLIFHCSIKLRKPNSGPDLFFTVIT